MKTIWKYPIALAPTFTLNMPMVREFVSMGQQGRDYFMWCVVDTDSENWERTFHVVGTGQEMPNPTVGHKLEPRGTFMTDGGVFVFHLFEEVYVGRHQG